MPSSAGGAAESITQIDAVGGCDDGAGPGGWHPRRMPEEAGAGTRGQQARPAQPPVVVSDGRNGEAGGDERPSGGVNRRNGRADQLQHVLRAARAGASSHAVILRSCGLGEVPDLQLGSGRHFHDILGDVQ